MDKKLIEIATVEAIERDKQNKLIAVTEKIISLKKKISENEIQATLQEKELNSLNQECNILRIDIEVQKQLIDAFTCKIETQENILINENKLLQNTQQQVWRVLIRFINEKKQKADVYSLSNAEDFVNKRNRGQELEALKTEVLELEGKVRALNMYKALQEKRLKFRSVKCSTTADLAVQYK